MKETKLSIKALIIGGVIVILIAYLTPVIEQYKWEIDFVAIPPPVAVIFFLFVLVMLNAFVSKFAPSLRLHSNDLLLIYAMAMVGAPLCSFVFAGVIAPNVVGPFYYASPENMWKEDFLHYIPRWFGPKDATVIRDFFEGGDIVPWIAWLKPLILWSIFVIALLFVFLCVASIIRRQWVERERLTFRLLMPMVEMTRDPQKKGTLNSLLSNKLMWLGFAIPIVVQISVGLHYHFPAFPSLKLMVERVDKYFTTMPWKAMGSVKIAVMYSVIGIAFLIPTDVAFSCWFFYLFQLGENILGSALGWRGSQLSSSVLSRFPDISSQGVGAFFALLLTSLWMMRFHLRDVMRKVWAGFKPAHTASIDDSQEPMSYRTAMLGIIGGTIFLTIWTWWAGLSPFFWLIFLFIFLVYQIVITRLRAETGYGFLRDPLTIDELMLRFFGSSKIGAQNLTILTSMKFFHILQYNFMPPSLEAYKISDVSTARGKHLTISIMIGIVLYVGVGTWSALRVYYKHGANVCYGWVNIGSWPYQQLSQWINFPISPNIGSFFYMVIGATVCTFLSVMRFRFLWWPFHPIGYVMTNLRSILYWIWFSFFIGWLFKVIIMRYGGVSGYRRFMPFFVGLIIGEMVGNGFWVTILDGIFGIRGFAYWQE